MAIDITRDMDKLMTEVDDIRKDLKTLSRSLRDLGADKGQAALAKVEHFGERARKRAAQTEERIEREIEDRPFVALLTAFGIGFLVAKLLDSSGR
ncbi:MAG TPA: hypothetical protein VF329_15430 [Gammaproteobacteria bacterium]